MCNQIALVVKRAGLGILDPTRTPENNYAASIYCNKLLVESLLTGDPLDIVEHQKHAINSQKSSKERQKSKELGQLADLKRGVNKSAAMQMDRACKSEAWLTVMLHGRHRAVSPRILGQHPLAPCPHTPPPPH